MDNTPSIDRRSALGALGLLGATAFAAGSNQPEADDDMLALGWDEAKREYVLPPLPYSFDALEPHIDAQTIEIHHGKHHAAYVKGLNAALAKLADARQAGDASLIQHLTRQASFHGAGHVNHTLFWLGMSPTGGGQPGGALAAAIDRDFASFDKFSWQFQAAAVAVEGSGWAWLAFEPISRRLLILQGENQQKLLMTGVVPLLGIDVWEHAYYLRYQNRRAEYVAAFMKVINWSYVEALFGRVAD
jgi:Fe-Mn family superoxide dismutase